MAKAKRIGILDVLAVGAEFFFNDEKYIVTDGRDPHGGVQCLDSSTGRLRSFERADIVYQTPEGEFTLHHPRAKVVRLDSLRAGDHFLWHRQEWLVGQESEQCQELYLRLKKGCVLIVRLWDGELFARVGSEEVLLPLPEAP